jgi:hypothetical protein
MPVRVIGLYKTINALESFQISVNELVDEEGEIGAQNTVDATSIYPDKIPGQVYERTGIYFKTFAIKRIGKGQWMMTSHAVQRGRGYSPVVGGGETGEEQAAIHQGRWPVFLKEAEKEAENTADRIDAGLEQLARSKGLQ